MILDQNHVPHYGLNRHNADVDDELWAANNC